MEAELEAKPSMEGAVPTMPLLRPVAWANTLLKSLSTPEPTPRMKSQAGSKCIIIEPSSHSEGAMRSCRQGTM